MAYFDKAIPPGGEGKIRLSVRTRGRQGKISRNARVYSNDPAKSIVRLGIMAFINPSIQLSPPKIYLIGKEDHAITKVVEVRAGLDIPLTLTAGQFNLSEKLTYTIIEIEEGRIFQIRFTSIPGPPQTYRGFLKLTTNYPEKPEITIWIKGRFLKEKSE
ncbi:MAG: hypothetical protein JRF53_07635 [Deltaproteobacteria bacterium]|nr:hypothetical protein [Deltaproteobacteria bacterium]MBW2343877.1 hypothetical protein [Deltaproteobacteria bacterium]